MTRNAAGIKAIKVYVILLAIGGMAFVASLFTNINLCPIYNIAGIPCFSCGMSRAFRSLPNFKQAFTYHPLFFVVPGIPLLIFVSSRTRNIAAVALIILFIAVWLARMILLFPHTPPMTYNDSSLLRTLIQ